MSGPGPIATDGNGERQALDLTAESTQILGECRMVLPGIQALFGFQLIAVFNEPFRQQLSHHEQGLHFAALVLVAAAVALVMAPAALHRQGEPHAVTQRFVRLSSQMLALGLIPLMLAICVDVYLIGHIVLRRRDASLALATLLLLWFVALWLVLPRWHRKKMGTRAQNETA